MTKQMRKAQRSMLSSCNRARDAATQQRATMHAEARNCRPSALLLLFCASLMPMSLAQVHADDVGAKPWWSTLRKEQLTYGVCSQGQDLCSNRSRESTINVCRCDAECQKYGDCCVDRSDPPSYTPSSQAPVSGSSHWRCIVENGREFYALATCPDDQAIDPDLVNHCLRRGDQLKHLQEVPVYSNASRIMYVNVFCAACREDLDALKPWKLELHCNRDWKAETILDSLFKGGYGNGNHELHGDNGLTCRLQVGETSSPTFWHEVPGLRECRAAISSCKQGAPAYDEHLCTSYTALVYSPRTFANYKNFHCFRCAGGPPENVECGARPATYGNDPPDVSHLAVEVLSSLVDKRKCAGTGTNIYDPLSNTCYKRKVNSTGAPSYGPYKSRGEPSRTDFLQLVVPFVTVVLRAFL